MKLVPNAFYIYVSDIERSTAFYESLFEITPVFSSPFYVAYGIDDGITMALWAGNSGALEGNPVRTTELGLNINLQPAEIDALYECWLEHGATTVEAPYDAVFGRTFLVADPDGNLIRMAPVD
ncbi:MAG: VOC family protein [Thermomicrobiales bacterium]|nr:VOC family protein [Thermomicrobiales bacterium]